MKREQEIQSKVEYFKKPHKLWSPDQIINEPAVIPKTAGVYGWYFSEIPIQIPKLDFIQVNGWKLLYVGISGRYSNKKGNIDRRIRLQHLGGCSDASVSTLRRTLGSLLKEELSIKALPKGTKRKKKFWFGRQGEEILLRWIIEHARVAWIKDENPREIEQAILSDYGDLLPLNIEGNEKRNTFSATLKKLRYACKIEAWKDTANIMADKRILLS